VKETKFQFMFCLNDIPRAALVFTPQKYVQYGGGALDLEWRIVAVWAKSELIWTKSCCALSETSKNLKKISKKEMCSRG
jgi:hypothetical protein